VTFPSGSAAWQLHTRAYELPLDAPRSFPVHPTQIYESLIGLGLFALLMVLRRRRRFSGQVFLAWVIGYGALRPLVEMLRDDVEERGRIPGASAWLPAWVSPSQAIGWLSVLLGVALLVALMRRHRQAPESLRYWEPRPADSGAGPASSVSSAAALATAGAPEHVRPGPNLAHKSAHKPARARGRSKSR